MDRTKKHLKACSDYKKDFIDRFGYLFCEVCGVNSNGAFRHEVHHIYFASRVPNHPELHNKRNLILVCDECHRKFHGVGYEKVFKRLEKERKLDILFK